MYAGSILPAPDMRLCGPKFKENSFYLQSTKTEAHRLITQFGCDKNSRILDIGCGQGRLPIGILKVIGELTYTGLDVDKPAIAWCKRYIENRHPSFKFHHLDIYNERYHKKGMPLSAEFKFGLADRSVDIVYLFSVFSHMLEKDMRIYLADFIRVLDKDGKVFFTAFVEEGVSPISINPNNYIFERYSGALHVVRYEKDYLFSILNKIGFVVEKFTHRTEVDGQSAIYLSKTNIC